MEVKHIWQVYVISELKIKLFCFFTIRTMVWIFITVKNMFQSFGCTKIISGSKWTKTTQNKVMEPTISNNYPRPIVPYHDHIHFDSPFIYGRGFIYLGFSDDLNFLIFYKSSK